MNLTHSFLTKWFSLKKIKLEEELLVGTLFYHSIFFILIFSSLDNFDPLGLNTQTEIQMLNGLNEIHILLRLISLVAHRFGRVGFWFSNICLGFFNCACLKKTITNIRYLEFDTSKINELPRTQEAKNLHQLKSLLSPKFTY